MIEDDVHEDDDVHSSPPPPPSLSVPPPPDDGDVDVDVPRTGVYYLHNPPSSFELPSS